MFEVFSDDNEIYLHGDFGPQEFGMISSGMVVSALKELSGDIDVHINSRGGNFNEAIGIFNAMRAYKGRIRTHVDALAASAASYVMQAADERIVSKNSAVMVHGPHTGIFGTAAQLRAEADALDQHNERWIDDFQGATQQPEAWVREVLSKDTWFTGEEIVKNGLADRLEDAGSYAPDLAAMMGAGVKIPPRVMAMFAEVRKKSPGRTSLNERLKQLETIAQFGKR